MGQLFPQPPGQRARPGLGKLATGRAGFWRIERAIGCGGAQLEQRAASSSQPRDHPRRPVAIDIERQRVQFVAHSGAMPLKPVSQSVSQPASQPASQPPASRSGSQMTIVSVRVCRGTRARTRPSGSTEGAKLQAQTIGALSHRRQRARPPDGPSSRFASNEIGHSATWPLLGRHRARGAIINSKALGAWARRPSASLP